MRRLGIRLTGRENVQSYAQVGDLEEFEVEFV
jgi:hypothetical protein